MSPLSLGLASAAVRAAPTVWSLPKNLLTRAGSLIEDFETAADWTVTGGTCVVSEDATHHTAGSKSLQLAVADGNAGKVDKVISWDLSGLKGNMRLDVYNGSGAVLSNVDLQLYLSSTTNYGGYFSYGTIGPLQMGWNTLNILESDWVVNGGGESWSSTMIRARLTVVHAGGATLSFDNLRGGIEAQPAVLLCFDDGWAAEYEQAFAYLQPRGLRGTLYAMTDAIGTDGFMTVEQIQSLLAAGWAIANHTDGHVDLTGVSEAEQEACLGRARAVIEGWGGGKGGKHVAYPFGKYDANCLTSLAAAGMLSGRLASYATTFKRNPVLPLAGPYTIDARFPVDPQTVATVKGWLDQAVARGEILVLGWHALGGGAGAWTVAMFEEFVDYVMACGVPAITAVDLGKLQLGAIEIPLPASPA